MAETKAETKVGKVEIKTDGLVTSWVSHGAELAERTASTCFGIVRDVRGELNQRVLGTLQFVDGTQQSMFKLLRAIDERLDKLSEEAIDTAESVTVGLIRALRDTSLGVTSLAGNFTRAPQVSRAA